MLQRRRKRRRFLNRNPQHNRKKATASPPAEACSSRTPLSKICFSFFCFDFRIRVVRKIVLFLSLHFSFLFLGGFRFQVVSN